MRSQESQQVDVGNIIRVGEITSNSKHFPAIPVGEKGDVGLITSVDQDGFQLMLETGEFKFYPRSTKTTLITIKGLITRLRRHLSNQYALLLSKGDQITMGSDPEIFVVDEQGTVIPAWEFLPREPDHKPRANRYNYADASAFYDGVQGEFTTIPSSCLAYHIDSIRAGLRAILDASRKKFPKCKLSVASVVDVPQDILDTAEETYVMLGCAPSYNVYPDIQPIEVPNPRALQIRFAGGHIHLGKQLPDHRIVPTIKALDAIVGVMSTAVLDGLEDTRRRQYYGRSGEFRLPPHGVEYRTLPSAIMYHPAITHLSFDLARQTVWSADHGYTRLFECTEDEVREAINESNVALARKIIRRNLTYIRSVLLAIYTSTTKDPNGATTTALRLMFEGAKNLLSDDVEFNWRLKPNQSAWIPHSAAEDSAISNLVLK